MLSHNNSRLYQSHQLEESGHLSY